MDTRKVTKSKGTRSENQSKRSSDPFVIYEDPLVVGVPADSGQRKRLVNEPVETVEMSTQTIGAPLCGCGCHRSTKHSGEASLTDAETHRLMVQEDVPPEYWEILAERRQDALNDSIKENEELRDAIERLRLDISGVSEMASQSEYFENMILLLTGNDEEASEESAPSEVNHSEDTVNNISESPATEYDNENIEPEHIENIDPEKIEKIDPDKEIKKQSHDSQTVSEKCPS